MRLFFLIITFLVFVIASTDSYSYPNNRPTNEAIEEDLLSCSPMWVTLGVCSAYLVTKDTINLGLCYQALKVYCGIRYAMLSDAQKFREKTYVANHRDLDGNGLNDFSTEQDVNCSELVGTKVVDADGIDISLTKEDVLALEGCYEAKGEIKGQTYELYEQDKECEKDGKDGIRVASGIDEDGICLTENTCDRLVYAKDDIGFEKEALVCAYEMDQLICAEAVYCSMNVIGFQQWGANKDSFFSILKGVGEACVDFSAINGRVADGVDDYFMSNPRTINCRDVCKIDSGVLTNQEGMNQYKNDCENGSCNIGFDAKVCIDQETQQIKPGCDPETAGGSVQIRGYIYNPKLYAHCVPKKMISSNIDYDAPKIISAYCSNKALVKNINNKEVDSFSGKAMRCIDQTIKNLFNGGYEIVSDKKVVGYRCISDDRDVNSVAECSDGLIAKFQDFSKNIVTILLVFSIIFIGIFTLLGAFGDIKKAAQYFIKFAIVLYFVYGDAWRDSYFDFFANLGTSLGEISFNALEYSKDGLTLPKYKSCASGNVGDTSYDANLVGPNQILYNAQETRFKIWDSFDCRWQKLFGKDSGFFDILIESFLSFSIYLIIVIVIAPVTIFLFILVMLKAMFVVISAMIVVMLLIFLSPLVIPLFLFNNKKLKGLFDNWLKNLIGYSLVPMILLMVVAIFFKTLDYSIYGYQSNSVYEETDSGDLVIKDDCRIVYFPCITHKFKKGYYRGNNKDFQFIKAMIYQGELMSDLAVAMFRLFFIFAVMYLVFSTICSALISKILGVSVMTEQIFNNMSKAAAMGANIGTRVAMNLKKKASHIGGAAMKALRGKNDYGLK